MYMVCMYCGGPTQVVNSRHQKRANYIWRRRRCLLCASIVTTNEIVDYESVLVIQKSPRHLEPFVRDQLFVNIYESCRHRPAAVRDASALTQTIISDLVSKSTDGVITNDDLMSTALVVLDRFDPVAATLYKAYRHT